MTYVTQELYQQPAISVIAGIMQSNPDRRRRETTTGKPTASKGSFAGKLDEKIAKQGESDIQYYSSGYTKDALPFKTEVRMKQYS